MRAILLATILASATGVSYPVVAFGETYACPSDPGFCYLDVGHDGCFDAGDAGPIDALLEAGIYAPPSGSIICPPSVRKLKVLGRIDWETSTGGRIVLFDAKIRAEDFATVVAGDRLFVGGGLNVRAPAGVTRIDLRAAEDVEVSGKLKTGGRIEVASISGDVRLTERASAIGLWGVRLSAPAGNVVLEGTLLRSNNTSWPGPVISASAGDDVLLTDVKAIAPSNVAFSGRNVVSDGKLVVKAKRAGHVAQIFFDADPLGEVRIARLTAIAGTGIAIDAGEVHIGLPGANGKIARSSLRIAKAISFPASGPSGIELNAQGEVVLRSLLISRFEEVDIATAGTRVELSDSRILDGPGAPGITNVTAGAGSTCDLTGSVFANNVLNTVCDTVVP